MYYKTHGLSGKRYEETVSRLLVKQHGRCAICGDVFRTDSYTRGWRLDHCHKTGKIRGLLCNDCNGRALGGFTENGIRIFYRVFYGSFSTVFGYMEGDVEKAHIHLWAMEYVERYQ